MAPQVSGDFVNYTVPIDMTGQPDEMYWLRAASVDVTGRTSTVSLSPLSVYSGPAVKAVTSLVAVNPATHNGHNVQMNLQINLMPTSNGPGGPGYGSFYVSLDGGVTQNPWLYTYDPATDIVSMLLDSNNHDALTTGAHTLAITYSQTITTDSYGNVIRTGTASWTGQASSAGMAVSATTPGPVFEGDPASRLRVTMTGVADPTGFVARIAAWRVADWPTGGGIQLGAGTCSPSCATLTVTVPLSKLTGGYPGQNDGYVDHGLQILVTDDAGVVRPFVVHVIVAAKARVSLLVPSTAAYGTTVHLLTGVQETNGQMLPGVPVTFQAMTGGSNVWRTVGAGTTNSLGLVSTPVVMAYNTTWRAVVAQRAGYNSAGVSPTFATAVPARVVIAGLPSSGYAYHGYTLATTVSPHSYGRLVYVLARKYGTTTWVTIAKPLTDSSGVARSTLKLARGTWYIRTAASGTYASASGYSATVTTVMR